MKILDVLKKLARLVDALTKLIPLLIEILEDLADDGVRNRSNVGTRSSQS